MGADELLAAALQMRVTQQAAVAKLGQQALLGGDLDQLLRQAASLLVVTLGIEFCKILELQPGKDGLFLRSGAGWGEGLVGHVRVGRERESQAGYTLLSHGPVIVEDFDHEERFHAPPLLRDHGVKSGMSVVIQGRDDGAPFGVLGVHTAHSRTFSEDDVNFLQAIANILAGAIQSDLAARDRVALIAAKTTVHEMETLAHQRAVVLETANKVALDILSSRTGLEALRHIADAARILAGARYSALGIARLNTQGEQELEEFVTVGITPEEQLRIGPLPRGKGVLGLLLHRTQPLRINNLSDHPASVGFPPEHPPMGSFLGVPIRRGNEMLGSLYLTNKQGGGAFTEADEAAVEALGSHAAVAIYNLRQLAQQRALTRNLLTAQEEERRAVAYDLHDGLTQYVMAAHAHLEAFRHAHDSSNEEKAQREIEKGLKYLKDAVVESRRMVNNLRLLVLDDLGLAGAIEQLVQEEKNRAGWERAEFIHDIGDERYEKTLETAVYRVAQEALTNARKHSGAQRIALSLVQDRDRYGNAFLLLEARDWGKGFEPEGHFNELEHIGLKGIIERVHLLEGTYELRSKPGQGTRLRARFPLLADAPES